MAKVMRRKIKIFRPAITPTRAVAVRIVMVAEETMRYQTIW